MIGYERLGVDSLGFEFESKSLVMGGKRRNMYCRDQHQNSIKFEIVSAQSNNSN